MSKTQTDTHRGGGDQRVSERSVRGWTLRGGVVVVLAEWMHAHAGKLAGESPTKKKRGKHGKKERERKRERKKGQQAERARERMGQTEEQQRGMRARKAGTDECSLTHLGTHGQI